MLHDLALKKVSRMGNRLVAELENDLTGERQVIEAGQVIVERGTVPLDDLFYGLREKSTNDGVTDIDALLHGKPQPWPDTSEDGFALYRVGDAVTSRSLHAALLDSYRIAIAL